MQSTDELPRGLGLSTATYVVIASMVGSGILISPGYMFASLNNHTAIFGLWVLGGALAMCGALCVAELAAAMPRAGGEYVYLREAYGPMPAFLSGWTSFLLGFSAPLAVNSYITATYVLAPFGVAGAQDGPNRIVQMTAVAIIAVITVPNVLGQRQSAWTQDLTTILKIGLFVALVGAGFAFGSGRLAYLSEGQSLGQIAPGTAATQLFYVMFAYSGWNAATYMAGEVARPEKTLPRALVMGTAVVILLYLALNLVFAYAVPPSEIDFTTAKQLPQIAAERLFGSGMANAFSVAIGLTFLATISAFIVTGPRVYYAMAKDGLFPAIAGRVDPRTGVPRRAMIAQSLCAIVILFVTDFQNLYKYSAVGLSLFSLLFIAAVYVLRWRKPEMARPFRVPGYPIVPAVYLLVTVFMGVFAFTEWKEPSLWSLGSILAGIPIYYGWCAYRRRVQPPTAPQ